MASLNPADLLLAGSSPLTISNLYVYCSRIMGLTAEAEVNDTSASPTIMPASFFSSELKEALSELSFGISGCKLGPSSSSEAQAFVDLLEGIRLDIRLHVQGFEIRESSAPINVPANSTFESLDTLLNEVSPKYRAKHADLLFARLSS